MSRLSGWAVVMLLAVGARAGLAVDDAAPKPSGSAAASLFKQLDANADGQLTTDEASGDKERLFKRLLRTCDLNGDGSLSSKEFADGLSDDQQLPIIESGQAAPEKPEASRDPGAMFRRLDSNRDGKVVPDEVPAGRREFFARLLKRADANHDGALDRKEFIQLGPRPTGKTGPGAGNGDVERLVKRALELDQNSDKRLSPKEAPQNLQKAFAKIDTNQDGQLDADELKERFLDVQKKQRAKPEKSKKSDKSPN